MPLTTQSPITHQLLATELTSPSVFSRWALTSFSDGTFVWTITMLHQVLASNCSSLLNGPLSTLHLTPPPTLPLTLPQTQLMQQLQPHHNSGSTLPALTISVQMELTHGLRNSLMALRTLTTLLAELSVTPGLILLTLPLIHPLSGWTSTRPDSPISRVVSLTAAAKV